MWYLRVRGLQYISRHTHARTRARVGGPVGSVGVLSGTERFRPEPALLKSTSVPAAARGTHEEDMGPDHTKNHKTKIHMSTKLSMKG